MQPDFEKANEIYFRLGIIYKQQQKFNQSLEVCSRWCIVRDRELTRLVLQIYCHRSAKTSDRRGHLVPDRTRP